MSTLDTITAFLRGKGLTPAQVAGVEGNFTVESRLDPNAYNAKEQAIGLAQWEGGRRTALQKFAAGRGSTERDLNTQLDFLWSELTGPERGALTALQATTTPAQAAAVFDQKFERSSGTSRAARINAAVSIAGGGNGGASSEFAGAGTGAAGAVPGGTPEWLTTALTALSPAYALTGGDSGGLFGAAFTRIGTWIVDGLLIVLGAALVIVAVVLLAKGGEGSRSTVVQLAPGSKSAGEKGAAGTAEEAAVAA
jgi:hypothetical protein